MFFPMGGFFPFGSTSWNKEKQQTWFGRFLTEKNSSLSVWYKWQKIVLEYRKLQKTGNGIMI